MILSGLLSGAAWLANQRNAKPSPKIIYATSTNRVIKIRKAGRWQLKIIMFLLLTVITVLKKNSGRDGNEFAWTIEDERNCSDYSLTPSSKYQKTQYVLVQNTINILNYTCVTKNVTRILIYLFLLPRRLNLTFCTKNLKSFGCTLRGDFSKN